MNKLFCIIFAVIASTASAQELSHDEKAWAATINVFHAEAKQVGMQLQIGRVLDAKEGSSPVAAKYEKGVCTIVMAVRGNFASQHVQARLNGAYGAAVARAAAVAHEYGHCVHMAALEAGEKLPPAISEEAEMMADVFALTWFAKRSPDDFDAAVKFFRSLRKQESAMYGDNLGAVMAVTKQGATEAASMLAYAADITKATK